jgi:transcription elongation GreA/GreB family factor
LGISGNSELRQAKQEIRRLNGALDILSRLDRKPRIVDNRQRTDCRVCNK